MPTTKKTYKHLPPRLRFKHGSFFYVAQGKWDNVGPDYALALIAWREREGIFAQAKAGKALTLGNLLDDAALAKSPGLAPATLREMNRAVVRLKNYFPEFLPGDVKPSQIAQYLEGRGSPTAANNEIAYFSSCWEYARRQGWIDLPNPCIGVKRNRKVRRKRVASPAEIQALTTFPPDAKIHQRRMAMMAKLALMTGIREGDMLSLTKHSVSDSGLYVQPQKTLDRTGVAITFDRGEAGGEFDRLLFEIMQLHRPFSSPYLFPVLRRANRGQPYETKAFVTAWRRYFASLGVVGLTWHDLRRTAINSTRRTAGIEAAQELAGHASVTTTEGYLENVDARKIKAVQMSGSLDRLSQPPPSRQIKGLKRQRAA